jgi:hypothetical protein
MRLKQLTAISRQLSALSYDSSAVFLHVTLLRQLRLIRRDSDHIVALIPFES